jgi:hypothetical protein
MPKFEVTLLKSNGNEEDEFIVVYDDALDWQDAWETAQMDYPDDNVVAAFEVKKGQTDD